MKRTKIVIGNWKMNFSVPESTILLSKYLKEISTENTEVVICPSFIDIYSAEEVLSGSKTRGEHGRTIKVGAQNVHWEDMGAHTGEVSAFQLKGFAEYCIVGHSERRHGSGETDKVVAKKAAACTRHNITPIICVGENLHENMDGLTQLVVAGQTEASLSELTGKEVANSIIAYEPVWAIGTGHVCSPKKAANVIKSIRNLVKALYGEKAAESVRIIYGGSVDGQNAKGFMAENEIDGFLVGGASLDHESFAKIVNVVDGKNAKASSTKFQKTNKSQITNPKSKTKKK